MNWLWNCLEKALNKLFFGKRIDRINRLEEKLKDSSLEQDLYTYRLEEVVDEAYRRLEDKLDDIFEDMIDEAYKRLEKQLLEGKIDDVMRDIKRF